MSASASLPERSDRSGWVQARRGVRNPVKSREPYSFLSEVEPDEFGTPARTWTVFLTNRECPWRCVMCDLWRNTLEHTLEPGLIPVQLDYAFRKLEALTEDRPRHLKLYNSGSFFDARAIPLEDHVEVIHRVRRFERLIVECHPALVSPRLAPFLELLRAPKVGASEIADPPALEVAMGLETAHPEALEKLNKGMTVADFQEAAQLLRRQAVALRVFLLLHPPFVPPEARSSWLQRSVQTAIDAGAAVISLIPLRVDSGALEQLAQQGLAAEPSLDVIESAFEMTLARGGCRVFLDLWDLERFAHCPECFRSRRERLERMNFLQRVLPPALCSACSLASGGSPP